MAWLDHALTEGEMLVTHPAGTFVIEPARAQQQRLAI